MPRHADNAPESLPVASSVPAELPEKQEALDTLPVEFRSTTLLSLCSSLNNRLLHTASLTSNR